MENLFGFPLPFSTNKTKILGVRKLFKKFLSVSAVIVLLFSLVACSGGEKSSGTTKGKDEKVTLDFWVFGSFGFEPLAKEYEKEHPNVKIKFNFAEMNDMHNNLFTAIASGSGAPDVAVIEVSQIAKFAAASDKFNNLYDFGAKDIQDNYLDWTWKNGSSPDGKSLVGIPSDIGPTGMFYRTDVFEEAGLPTEPEKVAELFKTWDDFVKVAKQIKEKTGKNIVDGPELIFNAKRDQAPQQYFNEKDELIIEDTPYVKEAYDFATGLIKEGVVGQNSLWTPEWGSAMADGSYAVLLAPSWMINVIKGNAPDAGGKWAVTTMPEGAGNWGGSFLAIPKQSKHSKEAYEFITWLSSPETQLKSFNNAGLFPSAPKVYEDKGFLATQDEYFSNAPTAKVFSDAAQTVKPVYMGKNYAIVNAELVTALTNVAVSNKDPQKEWDEAIKRIKKQLERN
jgi:cellobiose transport system substrate-binding protein